MFVKIIECANQCNFINFLLLSTFASARHPIVKLLAAQPPRRHLASTNPLTPPSYHDIVSPMGARMDCIHKRKKSCLKTAVYVMSSSSTTCQDFAAQQ
jgi:hypothetical protein